MYVEDLCNYCIAIEKNYSTSDTEEFVKRSIAGDSEAKAILLGLYGRLICKEAIKYSTSTGVPIEDTINNGIVIMFKHLEKWNPDKGKFTTYLTYILKQLIGQRWSLDGIVENTHKASWREKSAIYKSRGYGFINDSNKVVSNIDTSELICKIDVINAIKAIPDKNIRSAICKHFGIGFKPHTKREIAKQEGITSQGIIARIKSGLKKIEKTLREEEV